MNRSHAKSTYPSTVALCCLLLQLACCAPTALAQNAVVSQLNDGGRDAIRAAFRTAIDEGLIAGGSLLLLKDDRPIFKEAFGYADLENKRAFTTETVAHMASTSKPHTSTLIMMLVDEGLIDLDVPVSVYAPELKRIAINGSATKITPPTMRQLLSHTAGFESLAKATYDQTIRLVFTKKTFAEAATAISQEGLVYSPGTDYRYGQLGMVVAAHVAESVTGKDWRTLFRERLAGPIGANASMWYPDVKTLNEMAIRYDSKNGKLTPVVTTRQPRDYGLPIDPAGSLVSDLESTARLFSLHKNLGVANGQRLISEARIREMHKPQPSAPNYGLGLNLSWLPDDGTAAIVNHGGAFGTMGWADLETGIVGALFIQTRPRQIPRWTELIYDALHTAGVGRMVDVQEARRQKRQAAQ